MTDKLSQLMLARYRGDIDEVERLRDGAELDVFEAAALCDADRLREQLDADPALAEAWSSDGWQPLHFAAFFGHPETCRLLIERGVGVHARGFNQVAPINSAAANDAKPNETCTEIARLLLAHGADPGAVQGGGATALHAAAMTRNRELVRLLLAHGADPAVEMDDGRTPMSLWPDLATQTPLPAD